MTYAIKEQFAYVAREETGTQDPLADAAARQRQLPRFRAADDGGGALARPRGPVRLGLPLRSRQGRTRPGRRRRDACLGARSICPAPAGSSSTRPTASSAIAT